MSAGCRGLIIAGVSSGVGKTTIALGLMAAFRRRGLTVQPFKVGPDFIDPGHHAQAAGRESANLDGWMLAASENQKIFRRHCRGAEIALVEGVMGLFDGYDGGSEAGSTAQMAKWLGLPTVLVLDARSMARSAAAVAHGFATFDPDLKLAGVILNRIGSERHLTYLRQALAQVPGVVCLGGLPRQESLAIPERHLGLVTSEEHPLTATYLQELAETMEKHLDLEALLNLMPLIPPAEAEAVPDPELTSPDPTGGGPGPGFLLLLPGKFRLLEKIRRRTGAVFPLA